MALPLFCCRQGGERTEREESREMEIVTALGDGVNARSPSKCKEFMQHDTKGVMCCRPTILGEMKTPPAASGSRIRIRQWSPARKVLAVYINIHTLQCMSNLAMACNIYQADGNRANHST
jgi:hypothetical protein